MTTNRCPYCGGQIVVEYIGTYGDVYVVGKNGKPRNKRIRRFIYEHYGEEDKIVYCWDCRKLLEEKSNAED